MVSEILQTVATKNISGDLKMVDINFREPRSTFTGEDSRCCYFGCWVLELSTFQRFKNRLPVI